MTATSLASQRGRVGPPAGSQRGDRARGDSGAGFPVGMADYHLAGRPPALSSPRGQSSAFSFFDQKRGPSSAYPATSPHRKAWASCHLRPERAQRCSWQCRGGCCRRGPANEVRGRRDRGSLSGVAPARLSFPRCNIGRGGREPSIGLVSGWVYEQVVRHCQVPLASQLADNRRCVRSRDTVTQRGSLIAVVEQSTVCRGEGPLHEGARARHAPALPRRSAARMGASEAACSSKAR